MFEQNKQQIQQTHDIIKVIENKLNTFLQKRGMKQNQSPESYKQTNRSELSPEQALETKLQQMEVAMENKLNKLQERLSQLETENNKLLKENEIIVNENRQLRQNIKEIETKQKTLIDEKLESQRLQLQKRFEQQVSEIGDKAKSKLLSTLDQEEQRINHYNKLIEEKAQFLSQLDSIKALNKALQVERDELAQSYQNLLQMHNQMLQIDVNQNESYMQKKLDNQVITQLNEYKNELDNLKQTNEGIYGKMENELYYLRNQLERQKSENMELIREMSSMKLETDNKTVTPQKMDINDLYQRVFSRNDEPTSQRPNRLEKKQQEVKQVIPKENKEKSTSKSRSKSKRNKKQKNKENKISKDIKIKEFEKELKRLKNIVNDRIVHKKALKDE